MNKKGRLFLVGIGPGNLSEMTRRAEKIIQVADTVIGYSTYIKLIEPLLAGKKVIASGMTREKQRCLQAIDEATAGKTVALISSGDSGIYGMGGLLLELISKDPRAGTIRVELVPGVPAFVAAAAAIGAPLMNDFAAVSLSDLLTPWKVIQRRLYAAAEGDFVTCLYNPKSIKRTEPFKMAVEIFRKFRDGKTPCAIVRSVSRPAQRVTLTSLERLGDAVVDMLCLIIIGNSQTVRHGNWIITSRGYAL